VRVVAGNLAQVGQAVRHSPPALAALLLELLHETRARRVIG
jgi:hypothetical protein